MTAGANTDLSSGAAAEMLDRARDMGTMRVIVGVNMVMHMEDALGASAAAAQTEALRDMQSSVVSRVLGRSSAPNDAVLWDTIPFLAMKVTASQLADLLRDPAVVSVQEQIPSEPMLNTSTGVINADDAWNLGYRGGGHTVAILDTGIDPKHPSFLNRIVKQACFSTTDAASGSASLCPGGAASRIGGNAAKYCDLSVNGCDHGTHVAGIAVSKTKYFGVARGSTVIPIQVFSLINGNRVGSWPQDQVSALEWLYKQRNKYKIASANMSLGGGAHLSACDAQNTALTAVITKLRSARIATVIASGNNGWDGYISSPACISSAIAVGSTNKNDTISSFSNHSALIKLMAPGGRIRAAVPKSKYGVKSGTSMAAPHVAGAFALMRSAKPDATVSEILAALVCTGKEVTRADLDKPRIDVFAAQEYLRNPAGGRREWLFGSSNNASKWVRMLGRWAVTGGHLRLSNYAAGQWHLAYHTNCDPYLRMTARVKRKDPLTTNKSTWWNSGVFVKTTFDKRAGTASGYWFAYNGCPRGTTPDTCGALSSSNQPYGMAVIWKMNNYNLETNSGGATLLCQKTAKVRFNGYNELEVTSRNGVHDFKINGKSACSATDGTYDVGQIAVVVATPPAATDKPGHKYDIDYVRVKRLTGSARPDPAELASVYGAVTRPDAPRSATFIGGNPGSGAAGAEAGNTPFAMAAQ